MGMYTLAYQNFYFTYENEILQVKIMIQSLCCRGILTVRYPHWFFRLYIWPG